jgi:cation transport ATPase
VTESNAPDRKQNLRRTLMGALLALPQVAAWMFTASVVNLARQRIDVFFRPMWLAVLLIVVVLATGAVFVAGLWMYLKGSRKYTLAATGSIASMTAAVGLSFATSVYTF